MGKSALQFALKRAKVNPVLPTKGTPKQPPYVRGATTIATSSRLLTFRSCVGLAMSGASGNRAAIREKFASAAKGCGHK